MVMNKRLVAGFASLAVMGLALAGCGSGGSDTASKGSDGEVVKLTYLHRLPDSEGMTLVKDIVQKWNDAHPNIQVTATKFDGTASNMIKKLETDIKADNAPDLAQIGYSELPEVFTKGMLEDVTSEAEQYKDNFSEGPYKLMQVNGKTYGLPQDTGPLVYYYNQAEFEKLGIKLPSTRDELIAASKTAAAAGKYIMTYQADADMLSGLAGASGPWYTIKGDSWVVNTETKGSKAVADVFQQLLDAKAASTVSRWDPSFDAALQNSTIIGTIGAAWEAPLIKGFSR